MLLYLKESREDRAHAARTRVSVGMPAGVRFSISWVHITARSGHFELHFDQDEIELARVTYSHLRANGYGHNMIDLHPDHGVTPEECEAVRGEAVAA